MSEVRLIETGEVLYKSAFEDRLRRNGVSIVDTGLTPSALLHHGAEPVLEGAQPTGEPWQHAQRNGVEQINGQWFTKYTLTPDTPPEDWLDQRKIAKKKQISALLDQYLSSGYSHDFGGEIGIKILQTRNSDDRTNWLTSQASYAAAVAAGSGNILGAAFRTEDNVNIILSYADGLNVLLSMAAWGASLYAHSWALKDACTTAVDEATLDAINIESNWTTS